MGGPDMNSLSRTQRILVSAVLASLSVVRCTSAVTGDSPTALDPAFSAGLATVKHATGFIEDRASSTDWKPNLQLLVGVQAVEGSKRTIYFVQLTTLPPTPTNSEPWQPALRTNDWSLSASNKARFVATLYPVRVRVFDETGRRLKEGRTPMAWGMLTNGLFDMCRLGFAAYSNQTNSPLAASPSSPPSPSPGDKVPDSSAGALAKAEGRLRGNRADQSSETRPGVDGEPVAARPGEGKESGTQKREDNDDLARATGGGFLWMFGMLNDLQTVPAVANVWAKAQCAIRWPSAWTIAKSLVTGLTLSLEPRLKEVTVANPATAGEAEPFYRLPVDLSSGKRNLTRVEIIVGPAHGAGMLLSGIRSIHARHPTKPKQEFLAQVLAAGTVREP